MNPSSVRAEKIGRNEPAHDAQSRSKGPRGVDPDKRRLPHWQIGQAGQFRGENAEVGVVSDEHRPDRVSGGGQDSIDRPEIERPAEFVHDVDTDAQLGRYETSRLSGAGLRRSQHRVGPEAGPCQETAEAFGLAAAPLRQRPNVVGTGPLHRIAGMGVTQQA